MNKCPKCGSTEWDNANVGLIGAIVCTDCGEIYMMKDKTTMAESEFDSLGPNPLDKFPSMWSKTQ